MRISVTSTTSKLLLAIGPRPLFRRGSFFFPDGQVHPDTHAMHMDNYVIGVSNNVIVNRSTLGNSVSVHMQEALGICRDLGDRNGQASALRFLGVVRRLTGDYPAAARDLQEALATTRDLGTPRVRASAPRHLGWLARGAGAPGSRAGRPRTKAGCGRGWRACSGSG